MGTYVYRVTAEKVMCSDGKEANVAKFAYKPFLSFSSGTDKENAKMHFQSGAISSDRLAKQGKLTGRIAFSGNVFEFKDGTFYDHEVAKMKKVEGVTSPFDRGAE